MTPKDLDFVEAKNAAAREIALALGVPPLLLGIPGDNTYSNYAEANSALWRQTIIPLVERIALQLGNWLSPGFGNEALRLIADTDQSPALAAEKDALWKRLEGASFLTTDEKRIAAGYGANPNRLSEKVFNPSQPRDDHGCWSDGGDGSIVHDASRRRAGPSGTPAQEARFEAAAAQARDALRRLQELDPTWRRPESVTNPTSIEGAIAHQEAIARAAEARLSEILRDAIPGTNPSWGKNRLMKELYDRGFRIEGRTLAPGTFYSNPNTGEEVRIMERPPGRPYRTENLQKYNNDHYYRYRTGEDQPWGSHITIPNKP